MRIAPLVIVSLLTLAACKSTGAWQSVGGPVPNEPPVTAKEILTSPEKYEGRELVVEATPKTVCPKKGCWMLVDNGNRQMRITFKDHDFFVPLDSAGHDMRMAGTLTLKSISEADARHFLEDEGKMDEAKKIVGPQQELIFVATGVLIGPK